MKTRALKVNVNRLFPHPDNPRKDVGDISELTASIEKNGIFQNLTVIERDDHTGYTVLIGHRRLAAAKAAGLLEVPCNIVAAGELDLKAQIGVMLEENMQRDDLTIYEQAQSFQMLLDLGDNVETIAKRTGFSKTTVKHRLEIAKLDKEAVETKEDSFQLSLSDLIELEKIEDLEARNEVLKQASSKSDLIWRIRTEIDKQKKAKILAAVEPKLVAAGYEKMEEREVWQIRADMIASHTIDDELPAQEFEKAEEGCFYFISYNQIRLYKKRAEVVRDEEADKERLRKEKELEERKALGKETVSFLLGGASALLKSGKSLKNQLCFPNDTELMKELWKMLCDSSATLSESSAATALDSEQTYWQMTPEERAEGKKQFLDMPIVNQMFHLCAKASLGSSFVQYDGTLSPSVDKVKDFYKLLGRSEFHLPEAYEKLLFEGNN